jgi:S-adenosylmethionine-diacylglycerol 3-amino-3-carboxypropyl transferase
MHDNPLQFAVVREDPSIERVLFRGAAPRRALLVASGGCTALSLAASWRDCDFVLIDPNAAQLALVEEKIRLLDAAPARRELLDRFNVGTDDPRGLCQSGNFESLFRQLRSFVEEFVAPSDEIERWFACGGSAEAEAERGALLRRAFANPYWSVAFALFFADPLLVAMFTESAVQHALPGSYPGYFRKRIESGLLAADAPRNRYLHHIFLGRYLDRDDCRPAYLGSPGPAPRRFTLRHTAFAGLDSFSGYDLIGLSNVLDWTDEGEARELAARVGREADAGARILWRQLNNRVDREPWFGPEVEFDRSADQQRAACERSLFYETIHCGRKR